MASVVLSPTQISNITTHFCQQQFTTPNSPCGVSTSDVNAGISSLAMSVSIGGGSVAYSPAFQPPLSGMTATQQAALICYIIQTAMGVPLIG